MIHATASLYGFFPTTHDGGLVIGNRLEKRFLVILTVASLTKENWKKTIQSVWVLRMGE